MDRASCPQDAPSAHDASLRIYAPFQAGGRGGLAPEMTLAALVEAYYKPVHLITRDARPRHVEEVEQSVSYWVRFTGDPPLVKIDAWHTRDFVAGLKSLPGRHAATLANNTVRKHCGAIQAILDLCGPPGRTNREGLGLLEVVPYVARPRKEMRPAEDCFTFAELVRLVEHADAARLPDALPCPPGAYFRRLYALIFNTGMRIGGIMGSTWRNYHGAYLWLPPRIAAKGTSGQRIELNAPAREIVEAMRGADAERIFPWPAAWPGSRSNLYKEHNRIRQCLPAERRFAMHALRKLHNNELAAINGLACMKSLGHTTGRTTVEHYTSRTVVAEAVAKLPALVITRGPQRRLFD